jgi:hypothetical protein
VTNLAEKDHHGATLPLGCFRRQNGLGTHRTTDWGPQAE